VPQGNWRREFSDNSWARAGLKTTGLAGVGAPASVFAARAPMFSAGECW